MHFSSRHSLCAAALLSLTLLGACHHATLDDRAEQEARDFTQRYCPTPEKDMQRMDSISFDRTTHTFTYHCRLTGAADDSATISKLRGRIKTALLQDLVSNTGSKVYKDKGFGFRYVFRSHKTRKVLFEEHFGPKDYKEKP